MSKNDDKLVEIINRVQNAAKLQFGREVPLSIIAKSAEDVILARYGKVVKDNISSLEDALLLNEFFQENKTKKKK